MTSPLIDNDPILTIAVLSTAIAVFLGLIWQGVRHGFIASLGMLSMILAAVAYFSWFAVLLRR